MCVHARVCAPTVFHKTFQGKGVWVCDLLMYPIHCAYAVSCEEYFVAVDRRQRAGSNALFDLEGKRNNM